MRQMLKIEINIGSDKALSIEKGPIGPKLIQIKNKFNELECLIIAVKLHKVQKQ